MATRRRRLSTAATTRDLLDAITGGILADKLLGYRWAILLGGLLMAIGQFTLVCSGVFFYAGMAFMVVGNGMFKPNISTLVDPLPDDDPRRDARFDLLHRDQRRRVLVDPGLRLLRQVRDWTVGFGIAGVGMLLNLVTFGMGRARLGHGEPPSRSTRPA